MGVNFEGCVNIEERVKDVLDGMHLSTWYIWVEFDSKYPDVPDSLLGWVANEMMDNVHGCRYVRVVSGSAPRLKSDGSAFATIDVIVGIGPSMINLNKTVISYVIKW